MDVIRIEAAQPYEAPRHHRMSTLRLQGEGVSGAKDFTVGLSQVLPGGGADLSASDLERIYLVLDGELTVRSGGAEERLSHLDSCWIPAGEEREISNPTNRTVSFLVLMPSRKEP